MKPSDLIQENQQAIESVRKYNKQKQQMLLLQERNYQNLKKGDYVRISLFALNEANARKDDQFRKKFLSQWTKDIYRIQTVIRPTLGRNRYVLEGSNRQFYNDELQKVDLSKLVKNKETNSPIASDKSVATELKDATIYEKPSKHIAEKYLKPRATERSQEKKFREIFGSTPRLRRAVIPPKRLNL